jgi:hypothetical protein
VEEDPIQSEWLGYFNKKSRGQTGRVSQLAQKKEEQKPGNLEEVENIDSNGHDLDEIDGGNWYWYCANNSINRIDPDGKELVSMGIQLLLTGIPMLNDELNGKHHSASEYITAAGSVALAAVISGGSTGARILTVTVSSVINTAITTEPSTPGEENKKNKKSK